MHIKLSLLKFKTDVKRHLDTCRLANSPNSLTHVSRVLPATTTHVESRVLPATIWCRRYCLSALWRRYRSDKLHIQCTATAVAVVGPQNPYHCLSAVLLEKRSSLRHGSFWIRYLLSSMWIPIVLVSLLSPDKILKNCQLCNFLGNNIILKQG